MSIQSFLKSRMILKNNVSFKNSSTENDILGKLQKIYQNENIKKILLFYLHSLIQKEGLLIKKDQESDFLQ